MEDEGQGNKGDGGIVERRGGGEGKTGNGGRNCGVPLLNAFRRACCLVNVAQLDTDIH
jgi:hypothetical protein